MTMRNTRSQALATTANAVAGSFRVLSDQEKAQLQPLRIRVVTVGPRDTVASLSARMSGVDRKQELFRVLNGLSAGQSISAGDKVKIVTDK